MYEIKFETFQRVKILRVSFRDCDIAEFEKGILESREIITSQPKKSLLTFSEYYNVKWNMNTIKLLNEGAKAHGPYIVASALCMDGVLGALLKGAIAFSGRKNMRSFANERTAKKWLAEQWLQWEVDQAST